MGRGIRVPKSVIKAEHKVIALSILFGLFYLVIDVFHSFFFDEESLFLSGESIHESYVRMIAIAFFLIFGTAVAAVVTRRRWAEEALRESHERFTTVLESLDAMVYVADMKTHEILFANKYVQDGFGDIVGRICWQTLQTGQSGMCDFCTNERLIDSDGKPAGVYKWEFQNTINGRWYEMRDRAIQWVDGSIVRLEIATDITERKRTEEALRKSETKHRALLEAIPDMMFRISNEYIFLAYKEAKDFPPIMPPELFLGKSISEVLPAEVAKQTMHYVDRALTIGGTQVFEYQLLNEDNLRSYEARIVPCDEAEVVVIVRDITERKRAEEVLMIKDHAISTSNSAIAFGDLNANLTYVNDSFIKMWGYEDGEEVLGTHGAEFVESKEDANEIIQTLIANGGWTGEAVARRKDGSLFNTHLSASLVKDVAGNPVCMMASFIDITERKRAEEALVSRNQKLSALNSMAEIIRDNKDLGTMLQLALEETASLTFLDVETRGVIFLRDEEDTDKLNMAAEKGLPQVLTVMEKQIGTGHCLCGKAVQTGEIIKSEDCLETPEHIRYGGITRHGHIVVPIKNNGKVHGVMTYYLSPGKALTESEERLLSAIASQLAVAVENRRLFRKIETGKKEWEETFDAIDDLVTVHSADFTVLRANMAVARALGLDIRDIIGRKCYELFHCTTKPDPACPFNDLLDGADASICPATPIKGRDFEVTVYPILENEKLTGFVHIAKDVTEHRRMEEEYRTIIETSRDAFMRVDAQGKILDINDASCRMLGYSKEEFLNMRVNDIEAQETPEETARHIERIIAQGGDRFETRQRCKGGRIVDVEIGITFINHKGGQFVGFHRDITNRKQAEKALRESEERFRQIFEQNEDAIILFMPDVCMIIDANPAAEKLFGYTRQELIKTCPHICRIDVQQTVCSHDLADGLSIDRQPYRRKDGTEIMVSVRGKIIRLEENEVLYCSFRDITRKVRLEEEARLRQAQLIQANKMTALGTLVAGVAHEINNPNNFIMFNSMLVSDIWKDAVRILTEYYHDNGDYSLGGLPFGEVSDVTPKLLAGITDGSHRIKHIVDNLKDFVRPEKPGPKAVVDINKVVRASALILGNQIRKHTDNFHVHCEEGLPAVRGSSQQLEQVVINLIMNSLQALPDRGHGVKVSTGFDRESEIVTICVSDEGAGMPEDVLDRITEPFYTTKMDTGGTGLGLSISYSIIKEHRGTLEFDSEPGRGTTASIRFPAATVEETVAE
jgi:PAS domain S-box-containing protein